MMARFMSLRHWLAAVCLSLQCAMPAQAYQAGIVDTASGAAINGPTVVLDGHPVAVNAAGRFEIPATKGRLFVRAPGYRSGTFELTGIQALDPVLRLEPFTPKALYLTVYGIGSHALRGSALALVQAGAVNALVIDVKGDRGLIPYPSEIALAKSDGARQVTTIPDLAALVASLHAQGVYAIARIVTFKDQPLATAHPDLAVKRGGGGNFRDREGLAWTDPFQPEVRRYNIAIAVEAARAGFDEIQFDYLRFPDSSQRLVFAQKPTQASRIAAISGFLAEARQALLPYNTYLAADIFGYVCWNLDDTGIGQRLAELAPNVDYLSPMLYPSGFQAGIPGYRNPVMHSYEIVYQSLARAQHRLNISPKRFRPWLQAFKDYAFDRRAYGAGEVAKQIKAAADFGADGWMLWNPRNSYTDTGLGAAKVAVDKLPAAKVAIR